jgi:hypothetical protein
MTTFDPAFEIVRRTPIPRDKTQGVEVFRDTAIRPNGEIYVLLVMHDAVRVRQY